MNVAADEDTTTYNVVVNDEDQYSIWPARQPSPPGWREVGFSGPKSICLAHIDDVWVDMRPRSLRESMERAATEGHSREEQRHEQQT
jgi:MbtH protein